MEKLRILLVGHEGYIGSGLHEALSEWYDVVGWGRGDDINSVNSHMLSFQRINVIVNAAVVIDKTPGEVDSFSQSYQVNVKGVQTLTDAAKEANIPLVHLSSRDVFGDGFLATEVEHTIRNSNPIYKPLAFLKETDSTRPTTVYGKSKLAGEGIVLPYSKGIVVRLSSPYTTQIHKRGGWLQKFIESAHRGQPVTLYSEGKQMRDPIHVWDIANFIKMAITKNSKGLFHLGGPTNNVLSLKQITNWIGVTAIINPTISDYGCVFNYVKANRELDWQPVVGLGWSIPELKEKYENLSKV